ncbi:MAG: ATP-binding protein [Chloroflexota bacterium]
MTSSTPVLADHMPEQVALHNIIKWSLLISIVYGVAQTLAFLYLSSSTLVIGACISFGYSLLLVIAHRYAQHQHISNASTLVSFGLLGMSITTTVLHESTQSIALLLTLFAVAMSLPFLEQRRWRYLIISAWTIVVISAINSLRVPTTPELFQVQFRMSLGIVIVATGTLQLLWYYRSRMNNLLNEVQANKALLEVQVQERTAKLQERETYYRTIVEMTSDYVYHGTIAADGTWHLEWVKDTFWHTIGGAEQSDKHTWQALVETDDFVLVESHFAQVQAGQAHKVDFRVRKKDGSIVWLRMYTRPDSHSTKTSSTITFFGAAQDITMYKADEEQRLKLERRLMEMQNLESLARMAGGMAHDFNNLLTAILGNIMLAKRQLPSNLPVVDDLSAAEEASQRAAILVQQMLAFSGRGKRTVQTLDFNVLIEDLTLVIRSAVPKIINVNTQRTDHALMIKADIAQLRQLVLNLVTNAAEAIGDGERGTIELTTALRYCDSDYLADTHPLPDLPANDYIACTVKDNGEGMDEETLARMYDPFFSTRFIGRGLGLAAVYGIVRGHGGTIKTISAPGEGTSITVLLPLAITTKEPPEPLELTPSIIAP